MSLISSLDNPRKERAVPDEDAYLRIRSATIEVFQELTRERLPDLVQGFEDFNGRIPLCAWKAWRDALLERAKALGYVIAFTDPKTLRWVTGGWKIEAVGGIDGQIEPSTFVVRCVQRNTPPPKTPAPVLVTRGYVKKEGWVNPFVQIPQSLLTNPPM